MNRRYNFLIDEYERESIIDRIKIHDAIMSALIIILITFSVLLLLKIGNQEEIIETLQDICTTR